MFPVRKDEQTLRRYSRAHEIIGNNESRVVGVSANAAILFKSTPSKYKSHLQLIFLICHNLYLTLAMNAFINLISTESPSIPE